MSDSAIDKFDFIQDEGPPHGVLRANHFNKEYGYLVRRSRGREDWLLFYTVGGEGRFRYNELQHLSEPGEVTIIAPGLPHNYSTATSQQSWDFYWAHFIPRSDWLPLLKELPQEWPGLIVMQIDNPALRGRLGLVFERLLKDNYLLTGLQEALCANALEEIVLLLARQCQQASSLDPRVQKILEMLSHQLAEPLNVAEIARSLALSPSRVAHLFKEETGESIMATLLRLRMSQARRLLEFTNRPVNEIARSVGFQSSFHFSRQFKSTYGLSPQIYRKQLHT
jgi:AraC family transcriptional regulator, arabinose operon regulatory protein